MAIKFNLKLISFVISPIFLITSPAFSFENNAHQMPKNAIPAAFRNYNPVRLAVINVHIGDTRLISGDIEVQYNLSKIKIVHPKKLVGLIKGIKSKSKVVAALSGFIPQNYSHLCKSVLQGSGSSNGNSLCTPYNPKVAGVVFNPSTRDLYLFVNQKYLSSQIQQRQLFLGNSSSGLSYYVSNNYNYAYSQQNGLGSDDFSMYSGHYLGYKNIYLYGQSNFNDTNLFTRSGEDTSSQYNVNFTNVHLVAHYNGEKYKAGMISLDNVQSQLTPMPNILGVELMNDQDTMMQNNQSSGTPVTVYLTQNTLVKVIQNSTGNLIYTQNYKPGKYDIDTQSFPEGAYNITIEEISTSGQMTTKTMLYAKNGSIPEVGHPNYSISVGYLRDQESNTASFINKHFTVDTYSSTPALMLSRQDGLNGAIGLSESMLASSSGSMGQLSTNILYHSFNIVLSQLATTARALGNGMYFSYSKDLPNRFGNDANIHINSNWNYWYGHNQDNIVASVQKGANINNSLNFGLYGYSYSLSDAYSNQNDNVNHSLGLSIDKTFYNAPGIGISGTMSAISATGDSSIQLGISFSFPDIANNISATLSSNYQAQNSQGQGFGSQLNHNAELDYDKSYANGNYFAGNVTAEAVSYNHNMQKNNALSFSTNLSGGSGNLGLSGSYQKNSENMTFTAQNGLAITASGITFGADQSGGSGVMVDVNTNMNSVFGVYNNGNLLREIDSNQPSFFSLPPFNRYEISIEPMGQFNYAYSQTPRVVTLYTGNIESLQFKARREVYLMTQFVSPNKQPILNATIQNLSQPQVISDGISQLEIPIDQRYLILKPLRGPSCQVVLPKHNDNGIEYLYYKSLVCAPINQK